MAKAKPNPLLQLGRQQAVADRLVQLIAQAQLSDHPSDSLPEVERYASHAKGNYMPPSPGIESYECVVAYDPLHNKVTTRATLTRKDEANLGELIDKDALAHRSRCAPALAFRPLIFNELRRKEGKVLAGRPAAQRLALDDATSRGIGEILADVTTEHARFDRAYFNSYVNEHRASSVAPGLKWSALNESSDDELRLLFAAALDFFQRSLTWDEDMGGAEYNNIRFFTGMRNRPYGYAEATVLDGKPWISKEWTVEYEQTRTRPIQFHPALSMLGAFVPDKTRWASQLYSEACHLLGLNREQFLFPIVEGGAVYGELYDAVQAGLSFRGIDGVAWEGHVPTILGRGFRGQAQLLGPYLGLASGTFLTGVAGSLAALVAVRARARGYERCCIQGDDIIIVGKAPTLPEIANVLEADETDNRLRFMLGISLQTGGFLGAKECIDRATAGSSMRVDTDGLWRSGLVLGKHSDIDTTGWVRGYLGEAPDGRNLIKVVRGAPPGPLSRDILEEYVGGVNVDEQALT